MAFRTNKWQQKSLFDRASILTEREQHFLDKSWATPFSDNVFPMIDESKFEVLYCSDNGRPNTPINVIIGAELLKEIRRLTDEELLESILFDTRFQRALRLTSCDEIPFSDRTLSRFRARLYEHEMLTGEDLLKDEIERIAEIIAKAMKIDGKIMREDSIMIASSCKRMGRLELMYTCVANLVKALDKCGKATVLPQHFMKYVEKGDKNSVCYRLTKEEVATRLEEVTKDALEIYELAAEIDGGCDDFQILERMLSDQTENGELKPNKKVKPTSLQNPSDEDATYRTKAGKGHQGYVGDVVESCGEFGNIITKYSYDVNLHSDVEFGAATIQGIGKQEEEAVLITDGAYASETNTAAAEENNILFIPTTLTGEKPSVIVADFEIKDNTIISCPMGNAPTECFYNEEKESFRAYFDKECCANCEHRNDCPVKIQKNKAVVNLTMTKYRRAVHTKNLSTEQYKEYARKRNGVEGVPSELRRRYDVDNMPVRGLVRSKMRFGLKIGAINAKRFIRAISKQLIDVIIANNLTLKSGNNSHKYDFHQFSFCFENKFSNFAYAA